MNIFDIVIIGAGPAGGYCARLLAPLGYRVLLVEQHKSFQDNVFSSAATPLETLELFDLPVEVVGSFWNQIDIISTKVKRSWQVKESLGVVFDFAKLRQFLAEDAQAKGVEVWLGYRYLDYVQEADEISIRLKQKGGDTITVKSKFLVDATGFARAVIYPHRRDKPAFLKATGIEYLIEVDPKIYQRCANTLIFFLGHKWSPKGYSWIFPMEENRLKVGSAWLDGKHKILTEVNPLKGYIKQIIIHYLEVEDYKIIDVHGSILEYSIGLNDIYYRQPNIIAIGDAVSTVNFLGGEGIRHGMQGTQIAVNYIQSYFESENKVVELYQQKMKEIYAKRWNLSEQISRKVYLEYSDSKIDQGVAYLKYLGVQDIMDILFYYKLEKFTKGLFEYLKRKLSFYLMKIKGVLKIDRK